MFHWLTSRDIPVGRQGERIASRHLKSMGWKILARNWTHGRHEVDIIARHPAGFLVIVEVKTKAAASSGPRPETRVSRPQKKRLRHMSRRVARLLQEPRVRRDIIAVELTEPPTIRHHQGAF